MRRAKHCVRWAVVWAAISSITACAEGMVVDHEPDPSPRIVGGVEHSGDHGVGYLTCNGGFFCTASLIGSQTVLTAGHCVDDGRAEACTIEFNAYDATRERWVATKVADVTIHPAWQEGQGDDSYDHDVAVLSLVEPMGGVPTVPLASRAPQEDTALDIVGFGMSDGEDGSTGGKKRIATTKVQDLQRYKIAFHLDDGGTVCFGDSGGPAFAYIDGTSRQVGVHSTTQKGCKGQGKAVRVDEHRAWIDGIADDDLGCGGVDYAGYCDGTTLVWCQGERLNYYECADNSVNTLCGWTETVGSTCVSEPRCGNGLQEQGEACDFGGANATDHQYQGGDATTCGPDIQRVCNAGCGELRTREKGTLGDCDAGDWCHEGIDCFMSSQNGACVCE